MDHYFKMLSDKYDKFKVHEKILFLIYFSDNFQLTFDKIKDKLIESGNCFDDKYILNIIQFLISMEILIEKKPYFILSKKYQNGFEHLLLQFENLDSPLNNKVKSFESAFLENIKVEKVTIKLNDRKPREYYPYNDHKYERLDERLRAQYKTQGEFYLKCFGVNGEIAEEAGWDPTYTYFNTQSSGWKRFIKNKGKVTFVKEINNVNVIDLLFK